VSDTDWFEGSSGSPLSGSEYVGEAGEYGGVVGIGELIGRPASALMAGTAGAGAESSTSGAEAITMGALEELDEVVVVLVVLVVVGAVSSMSS
jgi:hypothetical protein